MDRKKALLEMLEATPNDAFLIYALALEEHKAGNLDLAITMLEELKLNQPEYLGTYYQLGKWQESKEEWSKAIGTYKEGILHAKAAKADKIYRELAEALMALEDE